MTRSGLFVRFAVLAVMVSLAAACSSLSPEPDPYPLDSVTTPAPSQSSSAIAPAPRVRMYSCVTSTAAQLLQWTGADGPITGTVTTATLAGDPPDQRVESHVLQLSGVVDGESVSITVNGQPQVFGTVSTDALSLQVQGGDGALAALNCTSTDPQGWNAAVDQLKRDTEGNNTDAAAQIQQQRTQQKVDELRATVVSSYSRLMQATERLGDHAALDAAMRDLRASLSDVKTAAAAVDQMAACELGDASVAAGDVGVAAGDVEVHGGDVDVQASDLEASVSDARDAIAAIDNADDALQQLGSAPEIDTASAIRAGEAAVTLATNAISAARSEAESAVTTADGFSEKAGARAADLCD